MKYYRTTLKNCKYYSLVCDLIKRNPDHCDEFGIDHDIFREFTRSTNIVHILKENTHILTYKTNNNDELHTIIEHKYFADHESFRQDALIYILSN